jgi:probable HAF family extracellular repeat protein
VNNQGEVVGMAANSNGVYRPFLYRNGVMHELPLGDGPLSFGQAIDINDAGQIVAQASVGNGFRGYLVTPEGILDLDAQTGLNIWPVAINPAGVIAANIPRGFSSEAITWSRGVVRYLGYLDPTNGSYALGINRRGEILAVAFVDSRPQDPSSYAVLFRDGGIVVLGAFGANALNDRGEVAGTLAVETGLHALLYRNGTALDLGTLPGDARCWAGAINNSGQMVGVSEDVAERPRAFLYTDGAMHDLNDLVDPGSGWVLSVADAINDRGQIVGVGYFHGQERAFLLTPSRKIHNQPMNPAPRHPLPPWHRKPPGFFVPPAWRK